MEQGMQAAHAPHREFEPASSSARTAMGVGSALLQAMYMDDIPSPETAESAEARPHPHQHSRPPSGARLSLPPPDASATEAAFHAESEDGQDHVDSKLAHQIAVDAQEGSHDLAQRLSGRRHSDSRDLPGAVPNR